MNEYLPHILDRPFKAVLFDLDGTLVDSEGLHYAAFSEAMKEMGYDFETLSEGINHESSFKSLFRETANKAGLNEEEFKKVYGRKVEITLDTPATEVDIVEGALSFLELLRELGIPMSVVTNSDRPYAEYVLESHGLMEFFEDVITYEEVSEPKPSPEGFLKAAKLLEVEPEDVLVIENSDPGIAAGKAAGMPVIAIRTTDVRGLSNFDAADLTIDDYSDPAVNHLEFFKSESTD